MPTPTYAIPGDIILARGKGWMSTAIALIDGAPISHATVYCGDDLIMETRSPGVLRHAFDEAFSHTKRIYVHRMRLHPGDMQPVLDRGIYYLNEGPSYAYDTLYLAAVLCLIRRLPGNVYLKPLLRSLFDHAAKWIIDRRRHGKEALVCSEFVYRCFDEAVAQPPNPYALSVGGLTAFRSQQLRSAAKETAAFVAPGGIAQGIEPGSLLDWLVETTEAGADEPSALLRMSVETPTAELVEAAVPQEPEGSADMSLEDLFEAYVAESRRDAPLAAAPAPSLFTADIHDSINRFLGAHQAPEEQIMADESEAMYLLHAREDAAVEGTEQLRRFIDTVADFVTPGDLYRCRRLYEVGQEKV